MKKKSPEKTHADISCIWQNKSKNIHFCHSEKPSGRPHLSRNMRHHGVDTLTYPTPRHDEGLKENEAVL